MSILQSLGGVSLVTRFAKIATAFQATTWMLVSRISARYERYSKVERSVKYNPNPFDALR